MKIIKLRKDETSLLKSLANKEVNGLLDNGYFEEKSSALIITLSGEDLEKITDILTMHLADKGVTDGEINQLGKQIDDLIDKFNPHE